MSPQMQSLQQSSSIGQVLRSVLINSPPIPHPSQAVMKIRKHSQVFHTFAPVPLIGLSPPGNSMHVSKYVLKYAQCMYPSMLYACIQVCSMHVSKYACIQVGHQTKCRSIISWISIPSYSFFPIESIMLSSTRTLMFHNFSLLCILICFLKSPS